MWNLEQYEERTAIITENGRHITYAALDFLQKEFAQLLEEQGPVFIIVSDTVSMIAACVSCMEQERQLLVLDENISKERLKNFVMQYQPCYIYLPIRSGMSEIATWMEKENARIVYTNDEYALFRLEQNDKNQNSTGKSSRPEVPVTSESRRLWQLRKIENRKRLLYPASFCAETKTEIIKYGILNGKTIILVNCEPDAEIFWKMSEWYGADAVILESVPQGKWIRNKLVQKQENIILLQEKSILKKIHNFMQEKMGFFGM